MSKFYRRDPGIATKGAPLTGPWKSFTLFRG